MPAISTCLRPHRRFDVHGLREPLSAAGFEEIDGGPLNWLSLHFLRGRKS